MDNFLQYKLLSEIADLNGIDFTNIYFLLLIVATYPYFRQNKIMMTEFLRIMR